MDKQVIKTRIAEFATRLQALLDREYGERYPNIDVPQISIAWGRRYAKMVRTDAAQSSVHSFVDMTNGNVLKAETWKKPAKHARGSVLGDDFGMNGSRCGQNEVTDQ